jgi:hypothetical protein
VLGGSEIGFGADDSGFAGYHRDVFALLGAVPGQMGSTRLHGEQRAKQSKGGGRLARGKGQRIELRQETSNAAWGTKERGRAEACKVCAWPTLPAACPTF